MKEKIVTTLAEIVAKSERKAGYIAHNTFGIDAYAKNLGFDSSEAMFHAFQRKKVLDASAGFATFGYEMNMYRSLRHFGITVISVEPTAAHLLELALRSQKLANRSTIIPRLTYIGSSNLVAAWTDEGLPFPSDSFDYVLDRNCFLLFYTKDSPSVTRAFREMKRVLKPGGQILTAMSGGTVDMEEQFGPAFLTIGLRYQTILDYADPKDPLVRGFILTK